MRPTYLLDTDWTAWYLRNREPFVSKLKEFSREGLALSIVSLGELYYGAYRHPHTQEKIAGVQRFLQEDIVLLPLSEEIAMIFGRERQRLRSRGEDIGPNDTWIAATALHHKLTLLTDDIKDFRRIPKLKIVSLKTR